MLKKEITKEEVNELPLWAYEGPVEMIDDLNDVDAAVEAIQRERILGIDTESKPVFKKGQKRPVALLQIATADRVYLFRVNKLGFPENLRHILSLPEKLKIGIDLTDDIRALKKLKHFTARGIVDLNEYCKDHGFKSFGARKLTALVLGYRVSKRQQTSNWEADVLSPQQIIYAATDAWICREIFYELHHAGFITTNHYEGFLL